MNTMISGGDGLSGGWLLLGAPSIHRKFGHVEGMHVDGVEEHVYCSNHSNTVKSYDWEF
jgi:hypothetical protein